MISWSDVAALAADLAAVPVATQDEILAIVADILQDPTLPRYDTAAKFCAAHLGTLYARGAHGPAGPVTGETVGPLSRQYAAPPFTDPAWQSTMWGGMFLAILELNPAALGTVT